MALDPFEILKRAAGDDDGQPSAPLGGTRAERLQRLQIGVFGIFAMVLLVGLADIVTDRLAVTEAAAVPEAAPTVEASEGAAQRDPLVDAGVAPELPTDAGAPGASAPTTAPPNAPPDGSRNGPPNTPDISRTGQNAPLQ